MTIELNIGLENNPYAFKTGEIGKFLYLTTGAIMVLHRRVKGEYLGNEERTLVMQITLPEDRPLGWLVHFELGLSRLCTVLCQDCIAYYTKEWMGSEELYGLIYDPDFKGEKVSFDPKYFIPWSK